MSDKSNNSASISISDLQTTKPSVSKLQTVSIKAATLPDVCFLCFELVMSGLYHAWNLGLKEGFWTYFGALSTMGLGYICLCCCIAEMSGMLPLSGGAYGLLRVTYGGWAGFMYGCLGLLFNVLFTAQTLIPVRLGRSSASSRCR
jgi:amino acid transporter